MGDVYRNTVHEVAVTVSLETFAHDPDWLARLEREAKQSFYQTEDFANANPDSVVAGRHIQYRLDGPERP
jgi:hypothetical protein